MCQLPQQILVVLLLLLALLMMFHLLYRSHDFDSISMANANNPNSVAPSASTMKMVASSSQHASCNLQR
jgi:hypothetical protein